MKHDIKDGRLNWADAFNVTVGFDSSTNGLERFGWLYTLTEPTGYPDNPDSEDNGIDVSQHRFDRRYFREYTGTDSEWDEAVVFKMTCAGLPDIYLVLTNSNDGSSSNREYDMKQDDQFIRRGQI